jgi:hypothetical protein
MWDLNPGARGAMLGHVNDELHESRKPELAVLRQGTLGEEGNSELPAHLWVHLPGVLHEPGIATPCSIAPCFSL